MARQGYQVLARKWRPQQFTDVVGQEAVVRTLANALDQGRTAHAYCFSGIRGVGKTTVARLLAKGLNCRSVDAPTATPCGECESCTEIIDGRSLDVFERDAASDRGINEMKELIEIARYAPSRDRYKVMILDEAHMLTPEASNALLKVLEEPPEYIAFVLATTEPNKILPTILSRCQHYQFARIAQRQIADHLQRIASSEGVTISVDGLALVATAADGSLRDAQSLLDKLIAFAGDEIDEATVVDLLGLIDRVLLFRAVELISAGDDAGVLGFVNEMVEQGIDLHQFTVDLLGHVRDLLVVRTVDDPAEILHLPASDLERLRKQAAAFTLDDLDRAFHLLAASEYRIKIAEQPRYHLEVVLTRLARMPHLEPIQDVLEALRSSTAGHTPTKGTRERDPGTAPRNRSGGSGASAVAGSSASEPAAKESPANGPAAKEPAMTEPATTPAASPTAPATPAVAVATAPAVAVEESPQPPPAEPRRPAAVASSPAKEVARPAAASDDDEPPHPALTGEEAPHPGVVTIDAAATTAPDPAPADPSKPASGSILARIQRHLQTDYPLVAQVLGRAVAVEAEQDRLTICFPRSAAIFAQRVRAPEVQPSLKAACAAVLGRPVTVTVDATAEAQHEPPAPQAAEHPASEATTPASPATGTAAPAEPETETPASAADADAHEALRRRAEALPLVQDLVRELRGQVISVEEL